MPCYSLNMSTHSNCLATFIFAQLFTVRNKTLGWVRDSGKRNVENTETKKGCNYRQQVRSCDRLLAIATVKLKMFSAVIFQNVRRYSYIDH
jgi:hypothetical protein